MSPGIAIGVGLFAIAVSIVCLVAMPDGYAKTFAATFGGAFIVWSGVAIVAYVRGATTMADHNVMTIGWALATATGIAAANVASRWWCERKEHHA